MASVELYSETVPQVIVFPEHATSGSFSAGDLVKIATNGKVQIATAGVITGIARRGYSGTEDTNIEVELIDPNAIYSARYKASATAQSLAGDLLDFTFTVGAHTLDEGSATTDVYCVGLDPRDGAATSGRLLVRFLGALLTASGT
jgi:hypothetical protein